ncbi:MAG: sugar phosphate isomerase/epimerase [Chitinophagaceae bacterium]
MNILFFCPRWGQEHLPVEEFLNKVKAAGYDGVECGLPADEKEKDQLLNGIEKLGLKYIGQHWETVTDDPNQHLEEYERRLRSLAAVHPVFINSQTGKDYFSFEENEKLIKAANHIAMASGIAILHETHRGKFSFAAHVMKQYLKQLPTIRITLDISHWCAVAETFLHDQVQAVETAIAHTDHIHARIGHTQGPQVIDPRSPENNNALDFHLGCWDKIIELKRKSNSKYFTITPEFGAPPYLHLFPYTQQPIVNQWEVNVFMMQLLKKRYA